MIRVICYPKISLRQLDLGGGNASGFRVGQLALQENEPFFPLFSFWCLLLRDKMRRLS